MPTSTAHSRKTLEDAELARMAVAGDGQAFAELYDRHEQRVYGFCMRLLGGSHDAAEATQETFVRMLARVPALAGRELNFVAYTLATARNVCYDMIRARRTVEPVAEQPDRSQLDQAPEPDHVERDPERFALLAAAREDVRAANAALPARQREVLALREVELLSYDEIGELMDLNRNAVAQLISRARTGLREQLRGSALASVEPSSPACTRALPLLATLQDEQYSEPGELDWVRAHLAGCESCRVSRAAMEEAGVSYRAIGLLVPLAWLRHATIARAAEFVGADWSDVPTAAGSTGGAGLTSRALLGGLGSRRQLAAKAAPMVALCLILVLAAASDIARDAHTTPPPPVAGAAASHAIATATRPRRRSGKGRGAPTGTQHTLRLSSSNPTVIPSGAIPVGMHHRHAVRVRSEHRSKHHHATHAPVSETPPPPAITTTTPAPPPSTTPAPAQTTTNATPTTGTTGTTPAEQPATNNPAGPPGGGGSEGSNPGLIP